MCHWAPLANFTARTSTCALGFSSATRCMCGTASLMAVLSAWILPSLLIEPEQSASQMKCSGRVASSPPGLRIIARFPSRETGVFGPMGGRRLRGRL